MESLLSCNPRAEIEPEVPANDDNEEEDALYDFFFCEHCDEQIISYPCEFCGYLPRRGCSCCQEEDEEEW